MSTSIQHFNEYGIKRIEKVSDEFHSDFTKIAEKWKDLLVNGDRYYNPNFSRGIEYRLALKKQTWHRPFFWR